jgi:hypothetical protein
MEARKSKDTSNGRDVVAKSLAIARTLAPGAPSVTARTPATATTSAVKACSPAV